MTRHQTAPVDAASAKSLASRGLDLGLVDTSDATAFATWLQADNRGFHGSDFTDSELDALVAGLSDRRTTGVWDATSIDAAVPVATVSSWAVDMTVPGRRTVPAWAISSVTVAPTHRRRGIARALLESELRTAHTLGLPLATLTVSESTIYGRFGFAPAAFATHLTIDTARTSWNGPTAPGRVQFITREQFSTLAAQLHEAVRLDRVGQIPAWQLRWDSMAGLVGEQTEKSRALRAVRYDDVDGSPRGAALYRVVDSPGGTEGDYAQHTLIVEHLVTETADAYAALWRYLLEVDLVNRVTVMHRAVDEPVAWQLSDRRAVSHSGWDHLWMRILDVTRALEGRAWSRPGRCVIEVTDDLDFASGSYLLEVDVHGVGRVSSDVVADDGDASVSLTVNELSALYLGGVSALELTAAGLIVENTAGASAVVDALFSTAPAPWLSIWF